jgi:ribosomal protein L37AE/L43A
MPARSEARTGMSERSAPFYCPYCGDENLHPHGAGHGEWECRACRRVFALSFRGILRDRPADEPVGEPDREGA